MDQQALDLPLVRLPADDLLARQGVALAELLVDLRERASRAVRAEKVEFRRRLVVFQHGGYYAARADIETATLDDRAGGGDVGHTVAGDAHQRAVGAVGDG